MGRWAPLMFLAIFVFGFNTYVLYQIFKKPNLSPLLWRGLGEAIYYLANATERVSLITVTLIWPG